MNQGVKEGSAVPFAQHQSLMTQNSRLSGFGERREAELRQAAPFKGGSAFDLALGFRIHAKAQTVSS
jgi:hypothetical protein